MSQFLTQILDEQVLKIEIFKLKNSGEIESIWKLSDWLEYNKGRAGQLIKNITRQAQAYSSQEQYIVVLFEKILEEFSEPHYGYLRINISINKMSLTNGNLTVDERIKFYFWVNVAGVCSMANAQTQIFKNYEYVFSNPKTVNGFKLMNDENEMMNLILPNIQNQGEKHEQELQKAIAAQLA